MMLPTILTRSFLPSIYNLLNLYIQNFVAHVFLPSKVNTIQFLLPIKFILYVIIKKNNKNLCVMQIFISFNE